MTYTKRFWDHRIPKTTIRLIDANVLLRFVAEHCEKWFEEMNISETRHTDIIEWIVMELYDARLREAGLRLIGHYADDDAKTICRNMSAELRQTMDRCIDISDIVRGGKRITGMMSGQTLIISKELKEGGR